MLTRRMLWLCMFLVAISMGLAAQSANKPLALSEITELLKGSVTPKRVATLVEQYGVSFQLTDDVEKELRRLGADDRLLLAISMKRVQPVPDVTPPPPSPRPTPPAPSPALTWTDPATGLMWTKESNNSNVTWDQAKDYCATLHLGGYSNWRLATIDELAEIYDPTQDVGGCHVKGGIKFHELCWSWSSSAGIASGRAWTLGFILGGRYSDPLGYRYGRRALCVRRSGE